jgi:hypothetical protein
MILMAHVMRPHPLRMIGWWPAPSRLRDRLRRARRTAATATGASATPLTVPAITSDG